MNTNEVEEEARFKATLSEFLSSNGIVKANDFEFKYNPFKLYQLVCRSGGFHVFKSLCRQSPIAKTGEKSADRWTANQSQ